ncbi:methyltransferase RsmF C-terminal domain-like protein, partial [Klebsiella pneumoniae]|uniref:methyltransferase RsmF C-terminal domain-like protein n=1 Tax=Klebsiella pneumoniae TaxID=573 RepID=UPI002351512F
LERWIKGSAILGCVGCLVGHLFMFLVGGKTPDQSVHLNLTTTTFQGVPLGLAKRVGSRLKNSYPRELVRDGKLFAGKV